MERDTWSFGDDEGVSWWVRARRDVAVEVVPSDTVKPLGDLVPEPRGTWAAVNGGFYEDGPMGLVVSHGQVVAPLTDRGGSGVLLWGPAQAAIVHRDAWVGDASEALQSIDRIVDAGTSLVEPRADSRSAARTAVALSDEYLWLVVSVASTSVTRDGDAIQLRSTVSDGLPLWAFAQHIVERTQAREALNLDGAVSTQLIAVAGEHRLEIRGERGTINAVVIHADGGPSAPIPAGTTPIPERAR